jgi:prepilin-type N-terminal cleavage/methylation domain-containing protein
MKMKTKLELIRAMQRRRKAAESGFTLVEVLVVAGILAILFASLVPNLLKAQARSQASAVISEAVGQARACQAIVNSGVGLDTFSGYTKGTNTAVNVICDGATTTAVRYDFNSRLFRGEIVADDKIFCPNSTPVSITAAADKRSNYVTVGVSTNGAIDCALTNA